MKVTLRTEPLPDRLYAKAGERLYCENGHFLAKIMSDVKWGATALPEHFKLREGLEIGDSKCPECGCPITGTFYYFEDTNDK